MIQYANYLAQIAYQVAGSPDPVTGELTYATDAQGNSLANAGQAAQDAATSLKGYSSNLDVVRQLTLFFGYGPLGH
jgi:bifunctional ADP-heptose synthase (sugar kinase/adenylyltransferase)